MHTYTRVEWEDAPSTETPISAENLNHMDSGLIGAYQDIAELKERLDNLSQQDASQMSVTFGEPGDAGVSDDLPLQTSPSTLRNIITSIHAQIRALITAQTTPHIGMIIHSTTLSTEAEVIAVYGGEHWIQHTGYFLYGGDTGVTANNAAADGGEPMHMLTVDEMPSHSHGLINELQPPSHNYGCVVASGSVSNSSIGSSGATQNTNYAGGGQPHNNMPPYKRVYIWECVSDDGPTFIDDEP